MFGFSFVASVFRVTAKQVTSRKLIAGKTVLRGSLRGITLPSRVTPREFIFLISVFPGINAINGFFPFFVPTVAAVGWEGGTLSSQSRDYGS